MHWPRQDFKVSCKMDSFVYMHFELHDVSNRAQDKF